MVHLSIRALSRGQDGYFKSYKNRLIQIVTSWSIVRWYKISAYYLTRLFYPK